MGDGKDKFYSDGFPKITNGSPRLRYSFELGGVPWTSKALERVPSVILFSMASGNSPKNYNSNLWGALLLAQNHPGADLANFLEIFQKRKGSLMDLGSKAALWQFHFGLLLIDSSGRMLRYCS